MDRSTLVQQDDLAVGEMFTVHSHKWHPNPLPIGGLAFTLTAIDLPYAVGKLVIDPTAPPIVLDLRMLNLMRASDDFVRAQTDAKSFLMG